MTCAVPHAMRPCGEADIAFVRSSWIRSMSDAAAYRWLPEPVLQRVMHARIERWLAQGRCRVAHAPEDANQLLGFICATPELVLYAYVKQPMRRMGLARAMVESVQGHSRVVYAAHWGDVCEEIGKKYPLFYQPSRLQDARRRQVFKGRMAASQ